MPKQLAEVADKVKRGHKESLAEKVVVPMAATLASVATSYLIKKAPEVYRDKVLPKVRERGGFEPLAQDLLQRVRETVDSLLPVDLPMPAFGNRASGTREQRPARKTPSRGTGEKNRREREQRRRARRQALSR